MSVTFYRTHGVTSLHLVPRLSYIVVRPVPPGRWQNNRMYCKIGHGGFYTNVFKFFIHRHPTHRCTFLTPSTEVFLEEIKWSLSRACSSNLSTLFRTRNFLIAFARISHWYIFRVLIFPLHFFIIIIIIAIIDKDQFFQSVPPFLCSSSSLTFLRIISHYNCFLPFFLGSRTVKSVCYDVFSCKLQHASGVPFPLLQFGSLEVHIGFNSDPNCGVVAATTEQNLSVSILALSSFFIHMLQIT